MPQESLLMSDAPILLSIDSATATLTFNRPQARNAIDLPLARALLPAAIRCDTDPAIRCVVLTGAGKLFCGGGDVHAFSAAGDQVSSYLTELAGPLHMGVPRFMRVAKTFPFLLNGPTTG